jgi:8-oxo-dGTP pyrophosphatase MutT (NUDIX family)
LRISAVREAFEESGVLLARRQGQSDLASAQDCAPVLAQRDAIAAGATSFRAAVANAGLSLALDLVVDFAHWITPKGMPKRFDTWFYIAVTPGEQIAAHDGGEAVDAVWIEPAAALSAAVSGARKIIFPTRLNIELLARSASAQGAMADARARAVRTVEPWIEPGPDGPILVIDPDAGYGAVRELLEPNRP